MAVPFLAHVYSWEDERDSSNRVSVLDENTEILIMIGSLFSQIAPYPVASANGHILEQAVPAFIADGAIVRMVHHEPFDHVLSKIDGLFIRGRYDHAVRSVHHAAHLYPFDRPF